ncbi:hypothetical protein J6590_062773 [Homalodisca vitripennis]|nr:hypothetical protein J6590_062773 [Homalodisca vitripennis]
MCRFDVRSYSSQQVTEALDWAVHRHRLLFGAVRQNEDSLVSKPLEIHSANNFSSLNDLPVLTSELNESFTVSQSKRRRKRSKNKMKKNINMPQEQVIAPGPTRKLYVFSDSHGKDLCQHLEGFVCNNYTVFVCSNPGAQSNHILRNAKEMSSEMTETDIGVIFVGTNDVSSCTPRNNRPAKQLPKLITQFVQTNKHTQWIIVPILHRHDLHWRNYLNYQINLINSKLKKLYGTWVVDIKDFGRRFFTNHGLHLNKYGKIEISRRISNCALQNTKVNSSTQSEPRDIATSQPINEYLPVLREIPKLSNRVTNSMMSSTPASAPLRMDNGTTLPSPPVSMQQYDTYSDALKTTCNSSHAAATEPSAISTASDVSEKNFENQRTSHLQSLSTQCVGLPDPDGVCNTNSKKHFLVNVKEPLTHIKDCHRPCKMSQAQEF